jgi:dipeptidyl aminopeptidase/acylaminoacyl peptidase/tetratricopeptide (TPR) repeat protein
MLTLLRRALCSALLAAPTIGAQTPMPSSPRTPFTANDILDVSSAEPADLSRDGRWLLVSSETRRDGLGVDYRRDTDPTYLRVTPVRLSVIDTRDGTQRPVFSEPQRVRNAVWSPDASRAGMLMLRNDRLEPVIWDRMSGRTRTVPVPVGFYVAENSDLRWSGDGTRIVLALRTDGWRRAASAEFERMTRAPVFVQDGSDAFLAWDKLRREGNVRAVYAITVATGASTELLPQAMYGAYQVSEDDSVVTWSDDITSKTDYDVIFGTENRVIARRLNGGTAISMLASTKGAQVQWSRDGRQLAWSKDGRVWVRGLADTAARQIAGAAAGAGSAPADSSPAAMAARAKSRYALVRWSPAADALLLSNGEGMWIATLDAKPMTLVVATNDTLPSTPRVSPVAWSDDGRFLYLTSSSRTNWERGIIRFDRTTRMTLRLAKDARLYSNVRLSSTGGVMVFGAADGNRPADLFVADTAMNAPRRLTDVNPALAGKSLASTRLMTFRDADGKTRNGVLYLPADYSPTRRYPTLFSIYEEFFDDTFDASLNVLTSQGYVVMKPSVGFETGFPGEAWLKGVTGAANALIEAGIADSARLGVYGTSYGGYATNLLITQTGRFKAAVNVSGKVDMISFYTDSPRLGVRNIHAAEKSQDRIGATLWQQPQKYIAHSAIMFADRITTPVLLITGAQDPNVPADNTREMYYALRRLGKPVTWVNYMNSGHGTPRTTAADFVDYHERISAFFDRHLKRGGGSPVVEATALTGEPLYRPEPTGAARQRMEAQLETAQRAADHTPANADSLIWLGRRTAYLGRFNDAIAIYTKGIAQFPSDARFYRHRGHRYLSTRQLPKAIADFERAYALTKGQPDQVEPDGQPNARNIPTSTLQSNIRYHLGLAYYLSGQFEKALPIYREDLTAAHGNPDEIVASSHWLYMTLRRLKRDTEAAAVLTPISAGMDIIENGTYHRLLLLYKGELKETDLLKNFGAEGNLDDVTTAYGVANWHLYNGRPAQADEILSRILAAQSQWASFGYLSAEAERVRK